jgi:glutaminase
MDSTNAPIIESCQTLFEYLSNGKSTLSINETKQFLSKNGFLQDDPRWTECYQKIFSNDSIDEKTFENIFSKRRLELSKAIYQDLIVPEFGDFCEELSKIFDEVKVIKDGNVADYIPQLSRVNPDLFGYSVCTIDGQRYNKGDFKEGFCIQSCSKAITYAIAMETCGEEYINKHVDKEPSGQAFNAIVFTYQKLPYNPMVNAGAIMTCSLVERDTDPSTRFENVLKWWKRAAGGFKPGFDNAVYLSEKLTADKNFAVAHLMKANNVFPEGTNIVSVLEFYFQCCSIEMNCNSMAVVASTLANGGVCPLTGERVFSAKTTRDVLSLMFSCGMYDYSGQFAFTIGLPAKSGVSGAILLVVPGVCGMCIWSPRLDKWGNSVKGIEFCKLLVKKFNFHNFDNLSYYDDKKVDPRKIKKYAKHKAVVEFLDACNENDMNAVKRMILSGIDVNESDYDKRTGLHVTCSEGHFELTKFLLENGANPKSKDRWDQTPLDNAIQYKYDKIVELINSFIDK